MSMKNSAASIVVIEDNPEVLSLLVRILERHSYSVHQATTVSAARELLSREAWDLALIDRNLPDGDGIALCAELRAAAPHNYLMMLTGDNDEDAIVEAFNTGADDYVTKPFSSSELLARIRAGLRIVELQKKLLAMTLMDALTGLSNRRAFEAELAERFEIARRYDRPLSLAILDVDHFKRINDELGHQAGDDVLRTIARVLSQTTRQSDFAARVGGEELAVLLSETPLFEAMQAAEKIRHAIAETGITISIGVASMPHSHFAATEEMIASADAALYRAKQRGRNRVEIERRRERFARPAAALA
jgi:two-component system, cell cycle response regulator